MNCDRTSHIVHRTSHIAHRFSTIRHSHYIYVMDRGAIAEQGTHEELLNLSKLYARLWRVQMDKVAL